MTELTNRDKLIAHYVVPKFEPNLIEDENFDYERYIEIKDREDFKEYVAGLLIEMFRKMY